MIYLFYGTKEFEINEEIKKISKDFDNMNISRYDLNNDSIKDIIEDCETFSLFQDKKIVIVENANIFTSSTNKDADLVEKYFNNINPSTILIFTIHNEKIDSRKKITKLINKKGKILEFNNELNIETFVKNELKNYEIENTDIKLLINRVGNNPLILKNEIKKIKIFKDKEKKITKKDILQLTNKKIDIDIFKLIDNIVKRKDTEAIQIYHDMLKVGEEPLKIVITLANQFRIMYQAKELIKKGYTEKDIASILKIHPYRVKLAIQNSRSYSSKTLLKYIYNLANIDLGIKTGTTNKDLALELFILKQ